MERAHRNKVQKKHKKAMDKTRLVCLDIPGDYEVMEPELMRLLKAKMHRHLPEIQP